MSSSCSKGFSWIIFSTWKHYRCNYNISATWLNFSLQLDTVSFSYLHKLNQAVDLNRISLCIFLSFTQVYILFTGRSFVPARQMILPPKNRIIFDIRVSFPFFSLAAARLTTICLLKEISFVLGLCAISLLAKNIVSYKFSA